MIDVGVLVSWSMALGKLEDDYFVGGKEVVEVATEAQSLLGDAFFVVDKTGWGKAGGGFCGGIGEYLY